MIRLNKELIKAIKEGREDKFYNSRTWRKKRKEILGRDNNECQMCKNLGKVGRGEAVHHIKHLKEYPHLAMTDTNLTTLCYGHHNEVHPEKCSQGHGKKKRFVNEERW